MADQLDPARLRELDRQIEVLANFIMAEVPGEPSQSQGAVGTAIRIIKTQADKIAALKAEVAQLREANGILEDALQEVGDDYPGSSCQEWCRQQVKTARAALAGGGHD